MRSVAAQDCKISPTGEILSAKQKFSPPQVEILSTKAKFSQPRPGADLFSSVRTAEQRANFLYFRRKQIPDFPACRFRQAGVFIAQPEGNRF